jgi:hypothetical protein
MKNYRFLISACLLSAFVVAGCGAALSYAGSLTNPRVIVNPFIGDFSVQGQFTASGAITTTSGGAAINAINGYAVFGSTTVGSYAPSGSVYVSGTTLTHNGGTSGYGWNNSANTATLLTLSNVGDVVGTKSGLFKGAGVANDSTDGAFIGYLSPNTYIGAGASDGVRFGNGGRSVSGIPATIFGGWDATGGFDTAGKLTVGSGATGIVFAPFFSGGYGAIYSSNVAQSAINYSLLANGTHTIIGASTGGNVYTAVAGNIVSTQSATQLNIATNTAVAGTLSSTGALSVPAGTASVNAIQFGGSATGFYSPSTGNIMTSAVLQTSSTSGFYAKAYSDFLGNIIIRQTAPAIASGFGTSPTTTASNTAAFKITVGTGGAVSGVLTFPAATTGWAVHCTDVTNRATIVAVAVSTSTTAVTVEAYSRTTGLASTFTAGDVIECSAMGY